MSKARKRHRQRWEAAYSRTVRWLRRRREMRKLGTLPPEKLVRFNDIIRVIYPAETKELAT